MSLLTEAKMPSLKDKIEAQANVASEIKPAKTVKKAKKKK